MDYPNTFLLMKTRNEEPFNLQPDYITLQVMHIRLIFYYSSRGLCFTPSSSFSTRVQPISIWTTFAKMRRSSLLQSLSSAVSSYVRRCHRIVSSST